MKRAPRDEGAVALSLWLRLLKAHNLILRRVRRAVEAGGGITLPQFDVLAQLARAPAGLTTRDLSARLLVSAGNLTGIVARLAEDGLVRREPVPHDRRSFVIRLTPAGARRAARLIPSHRRDLARILAPVPAAEREALRRLLGRAAARLDAAEAGPSPRPARSAAGDSDARRPR